MTPSDTSNMTFVQKIREMTTGRCLHLELEWAGCWMDIVNNVAIHGTHPVSLEAQNADRRWDWLRDAVMSALELGLPVTLENAVRLLGDRAYFESLLPLPFDAPTWGSSSGTEVLRQWWTLHPESYRQAHLETFRRFVREIDMDEVRREWAVLSDRSYSNQQK